MTAPMDFFNTYVMGSVQVLTGFYFFARFVKKRVKPMQYFLFVLFGIVIIWMLPGGSIVEFAVYVLLLVMCGILICHADWESALLYAALVTEIMQLSYGIVNSLLSILYPWVVSFGHKKAGIIFIIVGNMALLVAAFCYCMVQRYFLYDETIKKQYVLMILTPLLMLFLIENG